MTSILKLLANNCGLTMHETATFLDEPEGTVQSWWLSRRTCPEEVLRKMHRLQTKKRDMAGEDETTLALRLLASSGITIPQDSDHSVLRLALFNLPEEVVILLRMA